MLKNIPFIREMLFFGQVSRLMKDQVSSRAMKIAARLVGLRSPNFTDRILQLAACDNWSVRASKGRLYWD